MTKLITGAMFAAALVGLSTHNAQASQIRNIEGFSGGGFYVDTYDGYFCFMASTDGGANFAFTVASMGKAHPEWAATVLDYNNTGWGLQGPFGGNTCTYINVQ